VFRSLATVAATKVAGALAALGISVGVVIPLDESTSATAALTLVITVVLQVLWQIVLAWAEKKWPGIAGVRPLVLRVLIRPAAETARCQ